MLRSKRRADGFDAAMIDYAIIFIMLPLYHDYVDDDAMTLFVTRQCYASACHMLPMLP